MNIDDRLRAASKALKESSVAQVDAASRLREIVRRTGRPVAHGHSAVLRDEPQESPRSLAPSLPPSGKVSAAAAGRSAAATPTSHWIDRETMSTFHRPPPSENAVGRLLGSIWRYRWLVAAAVLLAIGLAGGLSAADLGFGAGTLLIAGETLVIMRESGELAFAPASPKPFRFLSRASLLKGVVRAYPALASGRYFVRNERQLAAFDLRPQ